MGKKLAIRGHATRGEEVIKLLEMMGGINPFSKNDGMVIGNKTTNCYYISENTAIKYISWDYIGPEEIDKYTIFTLEEFLKEYPHKIGDKVVDCYGNSLTIKSMSWYEDLETMVYDFKDSVIVLAAEDLLKYNNLIPKRTHEDVIFDSIIWHLRNSVNNGKQNLSGGACEEYFREVVKKNNENKMKNVLAEFLEHIKSTSKEELEREFDEIEGWTNVGPTVEEFRTFCECVNNMNDAGLKIENMNMNIEFDLTKYSYEVKNGKLVVSEKKSKYPKTYAECCEVLNCCGDYFLTTYDNNGNPSIISNILISINILTKLLICRDAYYKIAGEQMGLGKPWEPDWLDEKTKYGIRTYQNTVIKDNVIRSNCILVFPTPEIRDTFYENFNNLIEECKELL